MNKEIIGMVMRALNGAPTVAKSKVADEVENALEKQIAKKHHHTRIDHIVDDVRISVCPSCLAVILSHRTEYPNYCISCGTKIDWRENE